MTRMVEVPTVHGKERLNERRIPHLVVTGIFANTEDLKDGNGEMQVIELQVKE